MEREEIRLPEIASFKIKLYLMIYEINHIWTAEMKWSEEMIVAVNAIYAFA